VGLRSHYRLFILLFLITLLTLLAFNQFLLFIESQTCVQYTDLLHPYYNALNLSYLIFPLTYLPVMVFLISSVKKPHRLNFFAIAYILIIATRILTIYFFPLCEPNNAIRLEDGVLNSIFYANGYCGIDLFYSGHTATLFMLALMFPKPLKTILFLSSILLGTLLILQKVHYTIDVIAAFPITLLCYFATRKLYAIIVKEEYVPK
jgi:PAP2 superfamily C-terminal